MAGGEKESGGGKRRDLAFLGLDEYVGPLLALFA